MFSPLSSFSSPATSVSKRNAIPHFGARTHIYFETHKGPVHISKMDQIFQAHTRLEYSRKYLAYLLEPFAKDMTSENEPPLNKLFVLGLIYKHHCPKLGSIPSYFTPVDILKHLPGSNNLSSETKRIVLQEIENILQEMGGKKDFPKFQNPQKDRWLEPPSKVLGLIDFNKYTITEEGMKTYQNVVGYIKDHIKMNQYKNIKKLVNKFRNLGQKKMTLSEFCAMAPAIYQENKKELILNSSSRKGLVDKTVEEDYLQQEKDLESGDV